jgi:sugar lactone lactonase YvrE
MESIAVGAPLSTSLCFAGPTLDTLIVTTAQFNMTPEDLAQWDRAGDVFLQRLPHQGRLSHFDFR